MSHDLEAIERSPGRDPMDALSWAAMADLMEEHGIRRMGHSPAWIRRVSVLMFASGKRPLLANHHFRTRPAFWPDPRPGCLFVAPRDMSLFPPALSSPDNSPAMWGVIRLALQSHAELHPRPMLPASGGYGFPPPTARWKIVALDYRTTPCYFCHPILLPLLAA